MSREYPSLQRMLNQLNRPFANVKRWMNINALCMMLLVVGFLEIPMVAASAPDGYAPILLVFSFIALFFLVIIAEAYIAIAVFYGIGWMMNVPLFFAIGVVRGVENAERRYRDVVSRFYQRFRGRILFSSLVLVANLCFLLLIYIDWIQAGETLFPDIGFISLCVCVFTSAHILISFVAKKKQEEWDRKSDVEVHLDIELKRQRIPQLGTIPSVDEMEEILQNAKLGDVDAQRDAEDYNRIAHSGQIKNLVWMIIFFVCITLLFV